MLKNVSGLNIFMVNFWIVVLWHVAFFLACIKLPESRFDFQRSRFMPRDWEKGGRWYRDKLRIQEWKDKVPQFVSKDGFSKEHFTDMSLEYLDEFIMETCRAEWTHMNNCISVVVLLIVNFIGECTVCNYSTLQSFPLAGTAQKVIARSAFGRNESRYGHRIIEKICNQLAACG